MYFYFYKVTNKLNEKYYYGVHKTVNLEDGYMGSGSSITKAIKKYGKDSFTRDILVFFDDEKTMYEYEKEFITEDVIYNEMCYNETLGGRGGFSHIDNLGDNNPMKNLDVVSKLVNNRKVNGTYHTDKVRAAQLSNIQLAINTNIGKIRPEHSEYMRENSYLLTIQSDIESYRDLLSSWFKIISPDGVEYKTNRLEDFCKENQLGYTALWNSSRTNKIVSKGKSKGWICERINNEL